MNIRLEEFLNIVFKVLIFHLHRRHRAVQASQKKYKRALLNWQFLRSMIQIVHIYNWWSKSRCSTSTDTPTHTHNAIWKTFMLIYPNCFTYLPPHWIHVRNLISVSRILHRLIHHSSKVETPQPTGNFSVVVLYFQ